MLVARVQDHRSKQAPIGIAGAMRDDQLSYLLRLWMAVAAAAAAASRRVGGSARAARLGPTQPNAAGLGGAAQMVERT